MKGAMVTMIVGLVLLAAPAVAVAQNQLPATRAASPASQEALRLRYEIRVMERVLEQAVQHGVQVVDQQMQSLIPMMLFTGPARARGFRLDEYGFFFDVEVPPIRRSMAWSFQILGQLDLGVSSAVQELRQHLRTVGDPSRGSLEQALRRLEMQIGPTPVPAGSAAGSAAETDGRAAGPDTQGVGPRGSANRPAAAVVTADPVEVYASEVERAIMDAMLNHSNSLGIGSEEWLTVAARGSQGWLAPGDLFEAVAMTLRFRGRDLAAFWGGELTREEMRKRVEVQEF